MEDPPGSKRGLAELHSHTTYSDGVLSPAEVVEAAVRLGLVALAITDHDTIDGIGPARRAAEGKGLELISGVEFSSNFDGKEIHMLGLFIDETDADLVAATERSNTYRLERGRDIVGRLEDLGVPVDVDAVERIAGAGSIGRPHIARALVESGHAGSVDDAFRRFIGIGRPAFVPKPTLAATDVVDIIHGAGGVALLAHPASTRVGDDQIGALARNGLDGLEVYHPKHGRVQERRLEELVEQLGVLPSGGSDFHGPGAGRSRLGQHAVSLDWMEALRQRAATHARENVR